MSENNLTPEQDITTRAFFKMVTRNENILSNSLSNRSALIGSLLDMLNYMWLPNGAFVGTTTKISMAFGTNDYSAYPDEWDADEERAHEAIDNKAKDEASSGSKGKNTKVRKAVLPKDV